MSVFIVAGSRLRELSLTMTTHLCSSVREMRAPRCCPPPIQCPDSTGKETGGSAAAGWQLVSARLRETGASRHHHAVRVLPWGHPFGPVIFLSVAIAQCLHYASYQKRNALTYFSLLILFQSTDLKKVNLRNVPGEGVQRPERHHHGLAVSPQLLPDPVAIWKAGFGCLRHTVPPRDRLTWSWCPPVPSRSRKQLGFITSSKLVWYLTCYSRQWGLYYGLSLSCWPMSSHNFNTAVLLLISICCFVLFASRSSLCSFCSTFAQHLAWWHLVHEDGLSVLTYWK